MIRIHRERETHKKIPLFAGMSIIEKFVMVMGPILLAYLVYMMLDYTEYIWWLRVGMSIGITTVIWILIYIFASLMAKMDIQ